MLTLPRRRGDGGFALVIALLTTAIAFLIMTAVLAQAIHNVVLAGYGRRRVASVNAAEAGLNWYSNLLSTSSVADAMLGQLGWELPSSPCTGVSALDACWYVLGRSTALSRVTVANKPELATFELRVLLLAKDPCSTPQGKPTRCGLANVTSGHNVLADTVLQATTTPFPDTAYAVVRSTGEVGTVRRTLESYVRIRAVRTNIPGGFLTEAMCLDNAAKLIVNGDVSVGNQAAGAAAPANAVFGSDCRQGNVKVDSGDSIELRAYGGAGGSLQIAGGGLDVGTTTPARIAKDVRTEGAIALGSGGGPASSCGSATQCIQGDAVGSSVVLGPNAYVAGNVLTCSPACPPAIAFPSLSWNPADWAAPAWQTVTVTSLTSPPLLDRVQAATSPTVFHIPSGVPCDVPFDRNNNSLLSSTEIRLQTVVVIFGECRFTFKASSASVCGPVCGTPSSAGLLLVSASDSGVPNCGTSTKSSPGPQDVQVEQNPNIETGFFIYTPCFLWLGNNQNQLSGEVFIQGQFAARFLIVDQGVTLTEVNLGNFLSTLPGQLSGFNQDVRFIREIPTSIAASNDVL